MVNSNDPNTDIIDTDTPKSEINIGGAFGAAPTPQQVAPTPNSGFVGATFGAAPTDIPIVEDTPVVDLSTQPDNEYDVTSVDDDEESVDKMTITDGEEKPKTPSEEMSDVVLRDLLGEALLDSGDITSKTSRPYLGICIPLSKSDKNIKGLLNEIKELGEDRWEKERDDTNTHAGAIFDTTSYFQAQTAFNAAALEAIKAKGDQGINLQELLVAAITGTLDCLTKKAKDPSEKVITGTKASRRIMAQMQGYRRVALWNSGFFVTLRPLSLGEIAEFTNLCIHNGYFYGREMGGYFYLYSDISVKDLILTELFPRVIMDSTLIEWNRMGGDIIKHISLHDYDTILWALASLMFRDGVNVKYYCAENMPDTEEICGNIDEQLIDVSKLRIHNVDLITQEMITFMNSHKKVSVEDVEKYRLKLDKREDPFRFSIDNKATGVTSHWQVDLRVPTCDTYLTYGGDYNNSMFEVLSLDARTASSEDVNSYLRYNYYKLLIPWFSSISELHDPTRTDPENVIYTTPNDPYSDEDRAAIKRVLDTLNSENVGLDKAINEFVKKTKLTHVAYQYSACPKCGQAPSNAIDGFIPYDMQAHFFMLCLIRRTASQSE